MPDDKDKRAPSSATAPDAIAAESGVPADGARDVALGVSPAVGSGPKSKATDPVCPTCRGALERYAGEAAHKLGSFWCHVDGRRWHPHDLGAPADEATAPARTSSTKAAG